MTQRTGSTKVMVTWPGRKRMRSRQQLVTDPGTLWLVPLKLTDVDAWTGIITKTGLTLDFFHVWIDFILTIFCPVDDCS